MRVTFVINQLAAGGAEQQLVTLCEGLHRHGHEMHVVSIYDEMDLKARLDRLGIPVTVVGKFGKFDLSVLGRVRRSILRTRPDIVHAFLPASCLFTGLAKRIGLPAPVILSERSMSVWRSQGRILLDNFARRSARRVTCNARAIQRRLVEVERVPAEKTVVIYNGIKEDRRRRPPADAIQDAWRQIGCPAGAFVVACVANFVPEKDHPVLLEAFARARRKADDMFLVLVGKGSLEESVRAEVARLGLGSSTRFVQSCDNPAAFFCASNAAILCSSIEGCSNAVLEGMAMGLPLVVSDAGGNPELVQHGSGGFVCPVGDAEAFANSLLRLRESPELARRMGEHNAARVKREFADEIMIDRTLALYREVAPSSFAASQPSSGGRSLRRSLSGAGWSGARR